MNNRRTFLQRALGAGAAFFAAPGLEAQMQMPNMQMPAKPEIHPEQTPAHRPIATNSVITPDVGDLPYTLDGNTKVFHLVAEVIQQKIHPDKTIDAWGFNGSAPAPTIQVNQGDHVRVIFDNHLPEASSIHWHGFEDMVGYDGMPGISQEPVKPGGRFVYEFDIHQAGTYFYHSHMAMQEMMGMLGGFIMHPRTPYQPHCDKDFLLHVQEYSVLPNNTVPNTTDMEYNWLVLNGKAGPAATPMIVRQGDRVRLRFVNLGMDHHPMHLHGYTFHTTGTEGGRIQPSAWWPGNTVLVGVAQARDVELVADRPGDWMLHCHLPHHMMNQMSSRIGGMATTNGPLSSQKAMQGMAGMQGMDMQQPDIAANANTVPGFPQDAFMEGPAMAMDQMVEKPENFGLRPGWSGFMMGMMNFMRVLPPPQYDAVIARMKQAQRPNDPYASLLS
jgi:FtsP/CotA-like multicopper oxidase with cupredoxin domain